MTESIGSVTPEGLSRGCTMTEYTARSFAEEYRVSEKAARQYLKSLVKEGKATAVQKPLRIRFKGKEAVTRRTVTTYSIKEVPSYHR
jgi:predicted ArsR family transcriptional regulator